MSTRTINLPSDGIQSKDFMQKENLQPQPWTIKPFCRDERRWANYTKIQANYTNIDWRDGLKEVRLETRQQVQQDIQPDLSYHSRHSLGGSSSLTPKYQHKQKENMNGNKLTLKRLRP